MRQLHDLENDVHNLRLQVSHLTNQANDFNNTNFLDVQNQQAAADQISRAQAVNQIRNGDLSHSVRSWFNTSMVDDDQNKEAANWFSHLQPFPDQPMYEITSYNNPGANSLALKTSAHSAADAGYGRWERAKGYAALQGITTLDSPLPDNALAYPGRTLYVVGQFAKATSAVTLSNTARLYAGLWARQSGVWDWVKGSNTFAVTGGTVGAPQATTTRGYRIFGYTDRGFDYLTQELVVTNAPADNAFISNQVYVSLAWTTVPGILRYDVYRFDAGTNQTWRIATISNGANTFLDQNGNKTLVGAYPTATDTRERAYMATANAGLATLATDGINPWSTVALPVRIPSSFNLGTVEGRIWLRIGLTETPGGAVDHPILTDLLHASYQSNAIYSPHPEDYNQSRQPAVVSPNGSNQGGTGDPGGGGGDDGGIRFPPYCVGENETVWVRRGKRTCAVPAKEVKIGDYLESMNGRVNYVLKIIHGTADLYRIETANGIIKECTLSHKLIVSELDRNGTPLEMFKTGDLVLTVNEGREELSALVKREKVAQNAHVITFSLAPGHIYLAGSPRAAKRGLIKRLITLFFPSKVKATAICCHNLKPAPTD